MTTLFATLRHFLLDDKLGFRGSVDLKISCEWMLTFVDVLCKLSPIHGNLRSRGFAFPKRLSFSDGADDYKKKGWAVGTSSNAKKEFLEQVGGRKCHPIHSPNAKSMCPKFILSYELSSNPLDAQMLHKTHSVSTQYIWTLRSGARI